MKDKIQRIVVDGLVYENEQAISEQLNAKFQSGFTNENDFVDGNVSGMKEVGMDDITPSKDEVSEMLKSLDKRKASGPDDISC